MSSTEAWTVGRLLTWTADYLKKEGSTSPRLDAEVLLAHARKCSRVQLYTAYEEVADDEQRATFREMVKRRAEGTPVAYLVGYKEFYSAKFEVTPDVLIPRPETEHLVLAALDCAKQMIDADRPQRSANPAAEQGTPGTAEPPASQAPNRFEPVEPVEGITQVAEEPAEARDASAAEERRSRAPQPASRPLLIADVCTGSGIIAITMAKHLPNCRVLATEISSAAIEVARRNAESYQLNESRVAFLLGDLLAPCPPAAIFDLILSNPPYVSDAEYVQLDKSVREFEPKLALVAGPSGGEVIQRLIAEATPRLRSGGYLLFEFSPMLAEQLPTWIGPEWLAPKIFKDYAGLSRVVSLQKT